jgi:hypothetical protein
LSRWPPVGTLRLKAAVTPSSVAFDRTPSQDAITTTSTEGLVYVRLRPGPAAAAIIVLSLLVHGLQASALGLYWDDSVQLLQPLQGVDHEPIAFVLTDTSWSLRSERPFAFVAFALTRLAFLHSVAAVHWVLVGLLTLNAIAIAAVARRLVDQDWFGFAAAAIFVTYPLAPLQPLWAATVHYHVGCLLTLVSILCLDPGSPKSLRHPRWLTVGGFAAYLAALLTHEGLALIPPAFFAGRWLYAQEERPRFTRLLVGFTAILAIAAVWRTVILPTYGEQLYHLSSDRLAPGTFLRSMAQAVIAAFAPWRITLHYVRRPSSNAADWAPAAAGAAAIVGCTCVALIRRAGSGQDRQYWCALTTAMGMLAAAGIALAGSPIGIDYLFGLSYGARGNFVALPGIAIALPALAGALRLPGLVTGAALAGMVFVGSLLHFTVKQAFAREWEAHKTRFETLGALAPRLADNSLVIIFDERDRRAPFADHYEMSSYVLALYGDWSLLANTTRHLRFYRDGVEATYHGVPGQWFAPGKRGVIAPERLQPVGRIGYDRVVLFRNDHGRLRAVADTVVATEDGAAVLLHSNVNRILQGAPPTTRTWRHIMR